ncbi:macrolide-efflux protein [Lachnospiraceae bacterium KM106-2]|nr:macrolide-efflux protein [Lachnospiraceae bacterium KM106-2]
MKDYIVFWFSQAVSRLGSSMTEYALIIWSFGETQSALTVSLLTFCSFVPYIIVSLFAGSFVDRHSKKKIMVISDSLAAACSFVVLVFMVTGGLKIWHIYLVNLIEGAMNSFQSPASSVAIGMMVPMEEQERASGLESFSDNLVTVTAPMLAGGLLSVVGLQGVVMIDLITFFFAVFVLWFGVSIHEKIEVKSVTKKKLFDGLQEGLQFLQYHRGILGIMITMACINFFSRLTYENILSPMLLARSGGNNAVFGLVSGMLGAGGIIGGLVVSIKKTSTNHLKMIYYSAGISFLLGDLLMGLGRNVVAWSIAGLAASIPIPFIMAAQRVILYENVPQNMQGRIFAVRNAIQYITIPFGIILGGVLADYVFEPMMGSGSKLADFLQVLVGKGSGSGMAIMFLCTGIMGSLVSILGYHNKSVQSLQQSK